MHWPPIMQSQVHNRKHQLGADYDQGSQSVHIREHGVGETAFKPWPRCAK